MVNTEIKTERFYEEGNSGFLVYPIKSDDTYGDGIAIKGMISFDGTMAMEITNIAADDDTTYLPREKPATAEGTIAFVGLTKDAYAALYNNTEDSNGVMVIGRRGMVKKVAITFNNTRVNANGLTSENKHEFLNVTFSLPSISTQTVKEDDDTVRPFEVSFKANPHNYKTKDGKSDRATYVCVNSEDDKEIWEKVKDKLYIPDMDLDGLL